MAAAPVRYNGHCAHTSTHMAIAPEGSHRQRQRDRQRAATGGCSVLRCHIWRNVLAHAHDRIRSLGNPEHLRAVRLCFVNLRRVTVDAVVDSSSASLLR